MILPERFGRYIFQEKLVSGGMAQLYRAKIIGAEGFERSVVIKQILPHLAQERDLVSSFINEAKLAALLHHPNIVQVYDFGEMDDSYFISMEYLKGKDLRAVLGKLKDRNVGLGVEHSLYIASRICSALDFAHKYTDYQGIPLRIVHRDVSPQNIFITYEGDVKIIDFGIAKASSRSTQTQYGMIKGKVAYMSPEQACGMEIDHRSDIFSVGIILYETITNKKMFSGDTLQVLSKVQNAEFTPPEMASAGLPRNIYTIINRALAKDPDQRYQSCGDMMTDIEECMFECSLRSSERRLSKFIREIFRDDATDKVSLQPRQAILSRDFQFDACEPERERRVSRISRDIPRILRSRWVLPLLGSATILATMIAFLPGVAHIPPATSVTLAVKAAPAVSSGAKIQSDDADSRKAEAEKIVGQATKLLEREPEAARDLLIRAVGLDDKNLRAQMSLGLAYYKLKEFPNAAASYQRAVDIEASSPEPLFNLGSAYERMKDYRKAVSSYKKAVFVSSSCAEAYFNLGYIYLAVMKNYTEAEKMYVHAVELSPPYLDEALFNLAVSQDRQGKKRQCIKNLEKALAVNPANKMAEKYLAGMKKKRKAGVR